MFTRLLTRIKAFFQANQIATRSRRFLRLKADVEVHSHLGS